MVRESMRLAFLDVTDNYCDSPGALLWINVLV